MPLFASSRTDPAVDPARQEFAAAVRAGLTKTPQKELHSKYLYDELGTALFDAITHLPEYGLTRADARLLTEAAPELAAAFETRVSIAELGSGTGQKSRIILDAFARAGKLGTFYPIDVSADALAVCVEQLGFVYEVVPIHGAYLAGLTQAAEARRRGETLLLLFLGSSIGNFERPCAREFLSEARDRLRPGDALLLGADLVKPAAQLTAAYDDPAGVTAAFNRNILGRLNRELGANFDLRAFAHEARYDERQRRIEMHLRSAADQVVSIPAAHLDVSFREGETIWTESSHKFYRPELDVMAQAAGFDVRAAWVDQEWPFAETLWIAA